MKTEAKQIEELKSAIFSTAKAIPAGSHERPLPMFGPVAIRCMDGHWYAMNKIESGFCSFCPVNGTLESVIRKLKCKVRSVEIDQFSVYVLVDPA